MTALSEVEIFDCLTSNLHEAAATCDLMVVAAARGPLYRKLRGNLVLIEGACRQMGFWRGDMRFQILGVRAAECHKRAGTWLRRHAAPQLFTKLAEMLRKIEGDVARLRDRATGKRGAILVPAQPGPHRDTRPVYVRTSGLLVPASAA